MVPRLEEAPPWPKQSPLLRCDPRWQDKLEDLPLRRHHPLHQPRQPRRLRRDLVPLLNQY